MQVSVDTYLSIICKNLWLHVSSVTLHIYLWIWHLVVLWQGTLQLWIWQMTDIAMYCLTLLHWFQKLWLRASIVDFISKKKFILQLRWYQYQHHNWHVDNIWTESSWQNDTQRLPAKDCNTDKTFQSCLQWQQICRYELWL